MAGKYSAKAAPAQPLRVPPAGTGMAAPFLASRVAYRTGHATGSFGMGVVHGFTGVHPLSRVQQGNRRALDSGYDGQDRRRGDDRRGGSGGIDPERVLAPGPGHEAPRPNVSRTAEMGAGAGGAGPFVYDVRGGGPNTFPRDRAYDSARTGFTSQYVPASAADMAGPYGLRLGQGSRSGGTVARRPPIAL